MRKNEYAVMSVSVQYCKVWNTTHSKYLKHWPRIFLTHIANSTHIYIFGKNYLSYNTEKCFMNFRAVSMSTYLQIRSKSVPDLKKTVVK